MSAWKGLFLMCVLLVEILRSEASFKQRFYKSGVSDNPIMYKQFLESSKRDGTITKFDSTVLQAKETSARELFLITRQSWDADDLLENMLSSARNDPLAIFKPGLAVGTALSVLTGALIIPLLEVPDMLKNALGIVCLFSPFVVILLNLYFPTIAVTLLKERGASAEQKLRERIASHEAGHFIAGYLCGVPVLSYDVTGERDAGLELDLTTENLDARSQLEARMGHVLVVAMAGCAAELLRLGDSRGGGEDIPRALEILRLSRVGSHKRKAFLRWALLKAIVLLRLHRDALDSTTELMLQGADLPEIIEQIESSRIEDA